jgi:hypothetical protein
VLSLPRWRRRDLYRTRLGIRLVGTTRNMTCRAQRLDEREREREKHTHTDTDTDTDTDKRDKIRRERGQEKRSSR